jgi:hypothetical protein
MPRDGTVMTWTMHQLQPEDADRARLDTNVWRGVTTGLPVLRWVPILDIAPSFVMPLLAALASEGIAAHADAVSHRPKPDRTGPPRWRIWVDATAHARAEDVVRGELSSRALRPRRWADCR